MDQQSLIDRSQGIADTFFAQYDPRIVVALVSGGKDSLTAYYVASHYLHLKIDAVVHVKTETGIPETSEFVRSWAESLKGSLYMERSAGTAFEDYVLRKGFFGRGMRAHAYAYHVLKADPLRKAMSVFRQRRRNFPIMMISGIRLDESNNRKYNFAQKTIKPDPAAKNNLFVNIIEHFSARDCLDLLSEVGAPRNPVSDLLHASRECMCGTMQSEEDRREASYWFPHWGSWIDRLEAKVNETFPEKWGEATTKKKRLPVKCAGDLGMCSTCQLALFTPEEEADGTVTDRD